MAKSQGRTPEVYLPDDEELIRIIRRRPGISLREIAGEVWDALPWTPATVAADSASRRMRVFPVLLCGGGQVGNRSETKTAAEWLRDQLHRLVMAGRIKFAPHRRDEVDREAGIAYLPG